MLIVVSVFLISFKREELIQNYFKINKLKKKL